jgi:hypothetical protein
MSAQGRPKRELRPLGGSAAAKPQAWGEHINAQGRPKRESAPKREARRESWTRAHV